MHHGSNVEDRQRSFESENPIEKSIQFRAETEGWKYLDLDVFKDVDLRCDALSKDKNPLHWTCKFRDRQSHGVLEFYVDEPFVKVGDAPARKPGNHDVIENKNLYCTWYSSDDKMYEYQNFARGKQFMFCSTSKDAVIKKMVEVSRSSVFSWDFVNERETEKSRRYVFPEHVW
jgi:hypothetical protein